MMNCPLCLSADTVVKIKYNNSIFVSTGCQMQLVITFCRSCGFIFQQSAFEGDYDEIVKKEYAQFAKSKNIPFPHKSDTTMRAVSIIEKYIKRQVSQCVNILEIGSNRGDLLYILKERNPKITIVGVDPISSLPCQVPTLQGCFRKGLFSNTFDIVILQHVLEHIKYPHAIIDALKGNIHEESFVYIEVPNIRYSLSNMIEDFSLEHVNYFNEDHLNAICADMEVVEIDTQDFIRTVWKLGASKKTFTTHINELSELLDAFIVRKKEVIEELRREVRAGMPIVFYGISYYFRMIYNEVKDMLNEEKTFYYDDNYHEEKEPYAQIKRVQSIESDMIIVLCSNNKSVQDAMAQKLRCSNAKLVAPWRGYIQ